MSDFYGSLYDPWIGDEKQSHRRKARCEIWVAGKNVTSKFEPYLISVRIMDGATTPQCEIELDDRDAQLDVPPKEGRIIVFISWESESITRAFNGRITQVECGFGRKQGGRRMWLQCAAGKFMTSTVNSPMDEHLGDGADAGREVGKKKKTLQDWMSQIGGNNKVDVKVHPALAKLTRDYWGQSGESFMHVGERIAKQFGATFRLVGDGTAELSLPGQSVDGKRKGTVDAVWGVNLIAYRVHPWIARSTYGSASQNYFSTAKGIWKTLSKKFNLKEPFNQSSQVFQPPMPAPNSSEGSQMNEGAAGGFWPGHGRIVMNGEPAAEFQSHVMVKGARPGVDGSWRILSAEHRYSRAGYVTWLEVIPDFQTPFSTAFSQAYIDAWAPEAQLEIPAPTPSPTPPEQLPGFPTPGSAVVP